MQVRVITMKYNEGQQGFSEEALRPATFGRDVLAVETHFFMHGSTPHLTLVLQLADASGFEAGGTFKPRDPNAPNPEEALPEEWLKRQRTLVLKTEATIVAPVSEGVPFLGLRIFAGSCD